MLINTVEVNLEEARTSLMKCFSLGRSAYLWGAPGIGKTELIQSIAKEKGWGYEDVLLGTVGVGEAAGLPYIENGITKWSCPEFIERCMNSPVPIILFLDELNLASPEVQTVAYQLLRERRIRSHLLPPTVFLVAAGNRPEDNCNTYEMPPALMDRLSHYLIKVDHKVWINYADKKKAHHYVMSFIAAKPKYLDREYDQTTGKVALDEENSIKPTPRSWMAVSDLLHKYPEPSTIQKDVPGIVGQLTAIAFENHVRTVDALRPIREFFDNAADRRLIQSMAPDTMDASYGLIYNLSHACADIEDYATAIQILDHIGEIDDGLYRQEMKTAGFSNIFSRLSKNEQHQLARHPLFKAHGLEFVKSQSTLRERFNVGY